MLLLRLAMMKPNVAIAAINTIMIPMVNRSFESVWVGGLSVVGTGTIEVDETVLSEVNVVLDDCVVVAVVDVV